MHSWGREELPDMSASLAIPSGRRRASLVRWRTSSGLLPGSAGGSYASTSVRCGRALRHRLGPRPSDRPSHAPNPGGRRRTIRGRGFRTTDGAYATGGSLRPGKRIGMPARQKLSHGRSIRLCSAGSMGWDRRENEPGSRTGGVERSRVTANGRPPAITPVRARFRDATMRLASPCAGQRAVREVLRRGRPGSRATFPYLHLV